MSGQILRMTMGILLLPKLLSGELVAACEGMDIAQFGINLRAIP
jgi:membrane glycosyltransferase